MRTALMLALVLFTACRRPELTAFRAQPGPVVVSYSVTADVPVRQELEREYAAALRARLATRVTVVPEGVVPPAHPVQVRVAILDMELRTAPSPVGVAVGHGVAMATVGAITGSRSPLFDGFFWGLWAGNTASRQAQAVRSENRTLGYRPHHFTAEVSLEQDGSDRPFFTLGLNAADVIDAMDPLRGSDRDDPIRIREEEAKAIARVVVERLQEEFAWTTKSTPSFYRPEGAAVAPAATPEVAPAAPAAVPEPVPAAKPE